jgi:MFS transporter, DHA1 family, inner membrane transport protein
MAFFRNRAVNLLNLHYAIHSIALSGGAAFFVIYLLNSGVPIPGVLVSLALILIARFVIRPIVVGFAARWGLRVMVVAGTMLSALQYPLLAEVDGAGFALAALIAVAAVGDAVYWTTYHAYFAALGDDRLRGQQIGMREAIATVVGIASPLLTGWMLVTFGPRVAFGTTSVIVALAALPILRAPEVKVAAHVPGVFRAALPGILLFAADGWIAAGYVFVWQIALFVSLDKSLLGYGGALAVAALVGVIGGLALGRHIDAGHGKQAVWYAFGIFVLIVGFRVVATGNARIAVLANALGALGACLYVPTLMTAVYTLAKRSACTLRFHVATEGGWDVGGAVGLLVTALASELDMPLRDGILLSLVGVAAITVMLRRYYANSPATAVEAGMEELTTADTLRAPTRG